MDAVGMALAVRLLLKANESRSLAKLALRHAASESLSFAPRTRSPHAHTRRSGCERLDQCGHGMLPSMDRRHRMSRKARMLSGRATSVARCGRGNVCGVCLSLAQSARRFFEA